MSTTVTVTGLGKSIKVPTGIFIDNQFVKGNGEPITSINPATEETLAVVQSASAEDVDVAVKSGRKAFESTWGTNTPGSERMVLMHKFATLIEQNIEELAIVEALDCGKPIAWAKADIVDSVACIRYYAGHADKISGQAIEIDDRAKMAITRHEPVGVVAQIVPWNYPIMMWAWKVAPALAVGCSIVFKSAELTPLSTLKLAELIVEAGFPPGAYNVVTGFGAVTGAAMASHQDIDKIGFTGSTAVGRGIAVTAAQTNLKKVTLELGGKSPNIIFPSADLEQAVGWAVMGVFENMGQSCSAASRLLVHSSIAPKVNQLLVEFVSKNKVGSPLDEDTFHGPQISKAQYEKVLGYIEEGKKGGAKVECGGGKKDVNGNGKGWFIEETVFSGVTSDMKIAKEEIFGPVLVVLTFDTEEEAIQIANDTTYGLAAGIHTKDADQIMRVGQKLKAGTVWVNEYTLLTPNAPFGGYKRSGWGRELGTYGLEEYTIVKNYVWNWGEKITYSGGGPVISTARL